MVINLYSFTLCALCTLFASFASSEVSPLVKRLDLDEALRLAYLNSPALLSSLEDIAIAEQRLKMARHLFYPQLGFDMTATLFEADRSFFITDGFGGLILNQTDNQRFYLGRGFVEQHLYTGGRNTNAIVLAKAALEKTQNIREQTKFQVQKNVRVSFLEFLKIQDGIAAARELADLLTRMRSQGPEVLDLLWEEKALSLEMEINRLETRLERETQPSLLKAIGMDLATPVKIEGALSDLPMPKKLPSLEQCLSWAREFRPEYKASALESEMDATEVAIALAGRNPVISLAGMYEFLDNDFPLRQKNWSAMARVHLPLSWDNWANIRERQAQQRKGQVRRVATEDKIALEVRLAHSVVAQKLKETESLKRRSRRWQELVSGGGGQFKSEELRLRFFEQFLSLKKELIDAVHESLQYTYDLEYAMGRDLEKSEK